MRARQALTTTIGLTAALGMLGLWMAASAVAHVTVAAPGVTAGASDASITFHVPTESDTANTVGLKLRAADRPPIAGVLVAPQTGWTATITQTKLTTPIHTDDGNITQVVSEIDWKALARRGHRARDSRRIPHIAGKLPDGVTALTFKAIQIYSDGTQVAWMNRQPPAAAPNPNTPPRLKLPAASETGSARRPQPPPQQATQRLPATRQAKARPQTGIVLGIIGIALGAAALLLVVLGGADKSSNAPLVHSI